MGYVPYPQDSTRTSCCSTTLSYLIKAKFRRKVVDGRAMRKHYDKFHAITLAWLVSIFIISACSASFLSTSASLEVGSGSNGEDDNGLCGNSTVCVHGVCHYDICVCDFGWQGVACDQCGGRISQSSPSGYITDGVGNYSSELQCTWLIDSQQPNATIRLHFNHFETECSWDHLYIFDGDSVYAPMIAAFSGSWIVTNQSSATTPQYSTNSYHEMPEIVLRSGRAYLYFYSDAAYNMTGFNISYTINSCPNNCSGNGVCVGDGRCTCDAGFKGDACEQPICPNQCWRDQGQGECDWNDHKCVCKFGYVGDDCGQRKSDGYWSTVASTNTPSGRALHQTVMYQDTMFVLGGEYFDENEPFMVKCDMKTKKWNRVEPNLVNGVEPNEPDARFGHSVVLYDQHIWLYGGILKNGTVSSELWKFEISTFTWTLINTYSQIQPYSSSSVPSTLYFGQDPFCCPIATTGHSATLFNDKMIVIFGYNPTYGFLNNVQQYDFGE